MNDTTARIAAMVAERHRRMSPAERLAIAAAMFDDARSIVEASLPASLSRVERRLALIKRFYGDELPPAALLAFAAWPAGRR